MKYLLVLFFIFALNNCGGSKRDYTFRATVIDGYLAESNVSIYDKDNKLLKNTKTNNDASFSYRDSKNNFLYIKATSGIDSMTDEVFTSSLYGIGIKGVSVVVSPLSSLIWAYHKNNQGREYKELAKDIQKNLKLTKNILTFDPISNISNSESSKIIQINLTLEFITRLFNSALGGNFEDIVYASSYVQLAKDGNMDFLYSDAFISDTSFYLSDRYSYLHKSIVNLKLRALQSSIAYIVNEMSYLKANNKEMLKRSYKASYILMLPIIKEASLMQHMNIKDTTYPSEYFNDINHQILSLDTKKIIQGLKTIGGFRGILDKLNNIKRDTKTIKPSFFSQSFLNKELLLESSIVYDKLSKSIASGAPSQDNFKDGLINSIIPLNIENKDNFDSKIIPQIQNQVFLSFKFLKKDAINPNAELFIRKSEIKANEKSFTSKSIKLVDNVEKSVNNAISLSNLDVNIVGKGNRKILLTSKNDISIKDELQANNIQKQNKILHLVSSKDDGSIIKLSSDLELIKIKEKILEGEIKDNAISQKIEESQIKLSLTNDSAMQETIEKEIKDYEASQKKLETSISVLKTKKVSQEKSIKSLDNIIKIKGGQYDNLVEKHTEIKSKENKEQNFNAQIKQAKKVYDNKVEAIKKDIRSHEKAYEKNLNVLSITLSENKSPSSSLVSTLRAELITINSLIAKLGKAVVTKNDLAFPISFTFVNLKPCFNKDDIDLFSISIDQNNSFVKVEVDDMPQNTVFNDNKLTRKKGDGINPFYIPLGEYNVSVSVSNTDTEVKAFDTATFKVKSVCSDTTSLAFKAPLQIPNIPNLSAPELNTSSDLPNPNSGQNPPKIDDGGKPPKNN